MTELLEKTGDFIIRNNMLERALRLLFTLITVVSVTVWSVSQYIGVRDDKIQEHSYEIRALKEKVERLVAKTDKNTESINDLKGDVRFNKDRINQHQGPFGGHDK